MTKLAANGMKPTSGKNSALKKTSKRSSQPNEPGAAVLRYKGSKHFRQRVVCSVLSGRAIRIDDIRPFPTTTDYQEEVQMGIMGHEAAFLRLVDKLTNGTQVEINETGTTLRFKPGYVTGGRESHDCGTSRSLGWFIEGLLPLALFSKTPFNLTLSGITNDDVDLSVDALKAVTLPLLKHFGVAEEGGLELKVKRRGAPPGGGGLVEFICPIVRELKPIDFTEPGLIKRIRGNAYCTKVSPQIANRVAESSRGLLNRLLPDVWVHTDHHAGRTGGESPGFALSLVAESTTGVLLVAETAAEKGTLPEDLGNLGSKLILEEIKNGGCVDSSHQSLAMLLMVLCPEDVSRLRIGKLTRYSVTYLRHLRDFFGAYFRLKPDPQTSTVLVSCQGIGFKNLSRGAT
ncbi:unnamed protein product [Ectocarpus sp. 12 AP-2014]